MARSLPLHTTLLADGARLAEVDGWLVPADFGAVQAEYDALRHGAARIDLSLRGKLRVTGADRALFLHNMLTNDVRGLRPDSGCHAAKLTVQGKMEAGLHVLCLMDEIRCDIDPGPAPAVHAALVKHLMMEDARLEDVTDAFALVAVQGPQAGRVLTGCDVATGALDAPLRHTPARLAGADVLVVRSDHCGEDGFDLWVPAAAAPAVWQELGRAGARAAGLQALDWRRIEAGIPWAGFEIRGDTFPMEAGLDAGWISYTKGCYLGQETISRLHHLGHVNRSLRGLVFESGEPPARGSAVWAGERRAGEVTSAAWSPALARPVALAYLHREHAAADSALTVESGGERRAARTVALPFV